MNHMHPGLLEQELPFPDSVTELYRKLRHFPLPVLLTSGANLGAGGRFDILSAAPEKIFRTRGMETQVRDSDGRETRLRGNPIEVLSRHVDTAASLPPLPAHCPFAGGAIGFFSYDLLHPEYRIPRVEGDDISLPGMLVGLYHWAVIVDHQSRRCYFVARESCPAPLRREVLRSLREPDATLPRREDFTLLEDFRSNFTQREYLDAFQRIIDYIHAGDCYQVNLAQRFSAACRGDTLTAFERLQSLANAPFAAYIGSEEGSVLSFSPERFIRVRDGQVVTQPIKGTRPRHADPDRDWQLQEQLRASLKDRAENLMIVDLLRNDLGRVCRTGSVKVPALFDIQSFRNVHHMVSTIDATLERPGDVFRLLRACFPGGSITGAPKIRAMEIINELETRPRSVYCGAIAYIGFEGGMDSNICIRTLVSADDHIHCWGGGGIVADSVGTQEYQETLDKISIFINNLQ